MIAPAQRKLASAGAAALAVAALKAHGNKYHEICRISCALLRKLTSPEASAASAARVLAAGGLEAAVAACAPHGADAALTQL